MGKSCGRRAETDLPYSVIDGFAAMFDATPSCGLCSGFAHPGRSPPCFQFPLLAATLDSVFKNVGFLVRAPVSVVFSVDVHSTGAGKAKEGKCQKLKPSFEDYDLCDVRFADSAPQVWLLGRQLGSRIVNFFSAVAQVAVAAAAYLDGQEPFSVFFLVYLTIVCMSVMLPLLLGVLASAISVLVVTADRASAAWFAFVGHLVQMIAAATSLARAAAHKFVLFLSSEEVVSCSILAKVQHGCLATVLHGHVLGLRVLVVRFLTLVNLLSVLVGNISLAFSGLVTTTPCHEQRGSRSAFAQAKATPRVDVAETTKVEMELEKPECRFPVFVRTFSGTRTFYASSSMLISDFILMVSQSTAVPETSFYLTFQGTLLHGGHSIGEVGIGRDASLAVRGRLLGGATKGTSFPQYHEWYCVRCQRGGCWATKFSCFRCGLSRLESEAVTGGFLQPTSKGGGKGKGVFREAQYPRSLEILLHSVIIHEFMGLSHLVLHVHVCLLELCLVHVLSVLLLLLLGLRVCLLFALVLRLMLQRLHVEGWL